MPSLVVDDRSGIPEESLHLDFKRRAPGATFKLDPADRTCISKAFSGLANV
jgi:hypothetical protein